LRIDDEIVSFAGRPIRSVNQFKNILGIYPKGWELPLVFRREGQKQEIPVRLSALHSQAEMALGGQMGPQPRPDEKQPEEQPPHGPPRIEGKPAASPPAEYAHMLVKRPGFANYYFNELEQQRLLAGLEQLGDFSVVGGTWLLSGAAKSGVPFKFTLADRGAGLEFGTDAFFQPLDDSELLDEPPRTGGLLAALAHFRRLLVEGPNAFTEFYYLGRDPLNGGSEHVDVIATLLSGVESRWYFDQEGGLVGFDTRLVEDADECKIRFEEFRTFGGRVLPSRIRVQHAGQEYATFQIESAELRSDSTAAGVDNGEG
jgi:hypothetical protein